MPQEPKVNKAQVIIIGAVAAVVLLFVLIFQGILPGLQKKDASAPNKAVEGMLTIWGVFDDEGVYKTAIEAFKGIYPNLEISYRKFTEQEAYEQELVEALAVRKGPDIFMIPNGALNRQREKIAFAPQSQISLLSLRRLFPRVVEEDFVDGGSIGALPPSIDTLVLIYNRNLLNQAGIVFPPATWEELEATTPRLVRKDTGDNIIQAGIALGGSADTVARAGDIIKLLTFQNAAAEDSPLDSVIQSGVGTQALDFYKKFGNFESPAYTWNDGMPYSLDAFGAGRVAMTLGYAADMRTIRARSVFVEATAAKAPQKKDAANPVAVANYWGYTVSNQSLISDIAWQFIIMMTTNKGLADAYASMTGKPPALNSIIQEYLSDPTMNVFAEQALIARSGRAPDERREKEELESLIRNAMRK